RFHITPTPMPSRLSLHDALPISVFAEVDDDLRSVRAARPDLRRLHGGALLCSFRCIDVSAENSGAVLLGLFGSAGVSAEGSGARSEEHTSELQSRENLVCRLLLE